MTDFSPEHSFDILSFGSSKLKMLKLAKKKQLTLAVSSLVLCRDCMTSDDGYNVGLDRNAWDTDHMQRFFCSMDSYVHL